MAAYIQHHEGVVRLLPALPRAWPRGRLTGLRLPGGVQLDLEWASHAVTRATFTSSKNITLCLELAGAAVSLELPSGESVTVLGHTSSGT